jgi:hypothetical protein
VGSCTFLCDTGKLFRSRDWHLEVIVSLRRKQSLKSGPANPTHETNLAISSRPPPKSHLFSPTGCAFLAELSPLGSRHRIPHPNAQNKRDSENSANTSDDDTKPIFPAPVCKRQIARDAHANVYSREHGEVSW